MTPSASYVMLMMLFQHTLSHPLALQRLKLCNLKPNFSNILQPW